MEKIRDLLFDLLLHVDLFAPWTSLIYVSNPKCVYMCVKCCPSQTPNAFICVSPNAFICVSPNASVCVSPNAFTCVSPNAFTCVSPNAFAESATELASLAYLCSLRSHVFQQSKLEFLSKEHSCLNTDSCLVIDPCVNIDF